MQQSFRSQRAAIASFCLIVAGATGASAAQAPPPPGIAPVALNQPSYVFDTAEQHKLRIDVVAKGMAHPFALALLPDGDALISERGGALRLVRNALGAAGRPTTLEAQPVPGLPAITEPFRNAGLHDLALHPKYAENKLVYFTFNKPGDLIPAAGDRPAQRQARLTIQRARFDGRALSQVQEIFVGKSAGPSGSRLVFGVDGLLYLTTGAVVGNAAQLLDNTVGKVLRIRDDGAIPADNPYATQAGAQAAIFSTGHRDPLGLTTHPGTGAVLLAEHGPNGGDEVNVIESGGNYGWPRVTYGHGYDGAPMGQPVAADTREPLIVWLPSIGPSGLLVYSADRFPAWRNNLFVGSVRRGQMPRTGGLERVVLNDKMQELRRETLLTELHQRIRDVRQGPDGLIYVVTDEDDGALLRLSPE